MRVKPSGKNVSFKDCFMWLTENIPTFEKLVRVGKMLHSSYGKLPIIRKDEEVYDLLINLYTKVSTDI